MIVTFFHPKISCTCLLLRRAQKNARQLLPTVSVLILACRDEGRGREAARQIMASAAESRATTEVAVETLDLADSSSVAAFAETIRSKYGRLDTLVNNGAIAFKAADPTPFREQCAPTLAPNFYGTVALTEALWPLLCASPRGRLVNVASVSGRLSQLRADRQKQVADPALTVDELKGLVDEFVVDVGAGRHREKGWGSSNYGLSKCALIAYTKVKARDAPETLKVNCCCPGYCDTDMASHKGPRAPAVGARNAVMLAVPECAYHGEFISDEQPATW